MYKKIEKNQNLILKDLSQLRENILEEFLLKSTQLNTDLQHLLQDGIDTKRLICIQGESVDAPCYYSFIKRELIVSFQKTLDKLLNDSHKSMILQKFSSYMTVKYIKLYTEYPEVSKLMALARAGLHIHHAEVALLKMKDELSHS